MPPAEIFLSHSAKDRQFANALLKAVTAQGIPVFYSKKNIAGAQQWHDEIGAALARCDWFLLILSPDSVKSKWVKHELLYALQSDRYGGHIVPVLHRDCNLEKLSWTLAGFQHIDFRRRFVKGCRELLALWGLPYTVP